MLFEKKTLEYKGQVVFEKLTMPYFQRIPKLFQDNEACFMFINKGEFSVRTPDRFISFEKGKGLLAKCFDYFFETTKTQRASSDNLELIGIFIFPSIVEELFQFDVSFSSHTVDYNVKQVQINGLLNNFKESIDLLLDNPEIADQAIIKTKLKEFILLLAKTQNAPSQLDFLSAMFKKNSTEFRTTVNNNLYSSLSIDEFAHLCGMSTSTFQRKFAEVYSESPAKYILRKKMERAKEMLNERNMRVSDVAYDCGFDSISTFNRAFKKQFGVSPSQFRTTENEQSLN